MLCCFTRKEALEQQVTEECVSHMKKVCRQKENKGVRLRFVLLLTTGQGARGMLGYCGTQDFESDSKELVLRLGECSVST